MKLTKEKLTKIVHEAVADHMRLPKGANSRDDAADRSLDDPMPVEEANDTFFVRDELLDLEEDMQTAIAVLDDYVGVAKDPSVNSALDKLYDVARKLKQAAGLSPSKPPPLG